jgi:hypothetical protein
MAEPIDEPPAVPTGEVLDAATQEQVGEPASGLTETEAAVLAMERSWWKYPGAKETAIRDQFDRSPTRYYQVLNALIDRPDALAADPITVYRLRRLRAERQRVCSRRHRTAD